MLEAPAPAQTFGALSATLSAGFAKRYQVRDMQKWSGVILDTCSVATHDESILPKSQHWQLSDAPKMPQNDQQQTRPAPVT